jgi:hypothetical protein
VNNLKLELHSEKYAATGNLAADGYKKLLGAPAIELLGTLIREAIQNSCDAAKNGIGPEIHLRLRRLNEAQLHTLKNTVLDELPESPDSRARFDAFVEREEPWVLEIADFNTTGLAGPTRADKIPLGNDSTDFIDFMRNVGSRRDTVKGGGTYGYGKTSLYISSACSTIIVDTQTHFMGNKVRRFMGCHLGEAYQTLDSEQHVQRYTGRHWWGARRTEKDFVEPLVNDDAASLAENIGLPLRNGSQEGTTITILDPVFTSESEPEELIGFIAESVLWNFWPRMMRDTDESRRITIKLELDGKDYPIPIPEEFPPLDIFCESMRALRSGDSHVDEISSSRPAKVLGKLSIKKGLRLDRVKLVSHDLTSIPDVSSHIAVMRPVELVVRYFDGPPLPDVSVEWAGVFVTDDEEDVEHAFARAEPPAHDDWQPKILPKGIERTYVNVALRKIAEKAQSVAHPVTQSIDAMERGPSLVKVANKLGQFLDSVDDSNNRPSNTQKRRVKNPRKKRASVSQPVFLRLEQQEAKTHAVFSVDISCPNAKQTIKAEPMLVMDGGSSTKEDLGELSPRVKMWKNDKGEVLAGGDSLEVENFEGELEVSVSVPGNYAVTLVTSVINSEL